MSLLLLALHITISTLSTITLVRELDLLSDSGGGTSKQTKWMWWSVGVLSLFVVLVWIFRAPISLVLIAIAAGLFAVRSVLIRLKRRQFYRALDGLVPRFLELLILDITLGRSLSQSLQNAARRLCPQHYDDVVALFESQPDQPWPDHLARQSPRFLTLLNHSRRVREQQTSVLESLQLVRYELTLRTSFEDRLWQGVYQTLFQWVIMTGLYGALIAVGSRVSGLLQSWYFGLSVVIYIFGSLLFFSLLRSFRWTV
jgi:hypothetical protein